MQEKVIIPANEENRSYTKKYMNQLNEEYAGRLHFQLRGMDFDRNNCKDNTAYVCGEDGMTVIKGLNPSSCCDR
eukprot:5050396-Ditylum_brightwellii.AAC.1